MTATQKQTLSLSITKKHQLLSPHLNEKSRRLWAATEASSIGRGGVTIVAASARISRKTIRAGLRDLEAPPDARIRRKGGGRKPITTTDPGVVADLDKLVAPETRGDPMTPLRWVSKSTPSLAKQLQVLGHFVGRTSVGNLLKQAGYSLQANRKTREGIDHPDRNAQFQRIHDDVLAFQKGDQPVISVDTKKKENVGNYKNSGKVWEPNGQPTAVNMHDFPDKNLGKVAPYGIYDLFQNEGWVNVGIDHDTAEFAIASIRTWWEQLGKEHYPKAKELLITADCGGSNNARSRLWKVCLQQLANHTSLTIHVRHFPPGTSKWNKIEHRLFSFITSNWKGQPLIDRATVINLIANTTTSQGLKVYASLDEHVYPTGKKVSDTELALVNIKRETFHGEWNYCVVPDGNG